MIDIKVRPWRYVVICDKLVGCWPCDGWLKRGPILAYHLLVSFSIFLALVYNLTVNIGIDNFAALKCIISIIFLFALLSKLLTIGMNQKLRRSIYAKVAETFDEIVDEDEAKVLRDFADEGFSYTVIYFCVCTIVSAIFSSIPLIQTYHEYFFGDGRFIVRLPIEIGYGDDTVKYLLLPMLHFGMFVFSELATSVAFDYSLILQVQHVCALIKVFRMRVNQCARLFGESAIQTDGNCVEKEAYGLLTKSIELHGKAYELISLIEDGHSFGFFFLLLANASLFGAMIHLVSTTSSEPLESLKHFLMLLLLIIHFYVLFSQGQKIIDITSGISQDCYDCDWYHLPKKMHIVWLIMMVCSAKPRVITGGKWFILSRETYSKMLKAGISYYTVFKQ